LGKIIRDIWILTESGVTVFSRAIDPRVNPQIFGALISALNIYAEKLTDGGISNFTLSDIRFVIIKRAPFLFVANASNKIKTKKVTDELRVISDKFFKTYSQDVLDNWDSDVSVFNNFKNLIDDSLDETAKKFQESFW